MAAIYLHIPFCLRKCRYCDFFSVEETGGMARFLAALDLEIGLAAPGGLPAPARSVYFGGGTPSLLAPDQVAAILAALRRALPIAPDAEISLEANPGTLTPRSLDGYRAAGVTRLSLGVQSFRDTHLARLGRIHHRDEALQAVALARAAGFDNLGLDLIYALPGQTIGQWEEDLRTAIALAPRHLSAYGLTLERHTPLGEQVAAGKLRPAPGDIEAAMLERTMELLAAAGFEQYEVSNYARPGFRCRHNLAYWTHADYLGLGPSAHSFRREGRTAGRRWWNLASLEGYGEALEAGRRPVAAEERLGPAEFLRERIFLGLRCGGLELEDLAGDFGCDLTATRGAVLEELAAAGLAALEGAALRLTPAGLRLADEIARRLLP